MLQTSKPRKPLTNNTNNQNFTQMLINYAKCKKAKNQKINTTRQKDKQNKKDDRQAIFIEDCIKFKQPQKNNIKFDIFKQDKKPKEFPLQQSFGRVFVNPTQNNNKLKNSSKKTSHQIIMNRSRKSNNIQNASFEQAIKKIFKDLDIFNRGRISQTNINKWIPQSALYFLGGVFQKIKIQRLNLTQNQFIKLCLPLIQKSNQQDILLFIQQVIGKQNGLNVSFEFDQQQKNNQNSPIIKKINLFSHSQKQNKFNQQKIFSTLKKNQWFNDNQANRTSNHKNTSSIQKNKNVNIVDKGSNSKSHRKDQVYGVQLNKSDYKRQKYNIVAQTPDKKNQKVQQFNYSLLSKDKKINQQIPLKNKQLQINSFTSNVTGRSPVKNVFNVIQKYSNLQKAELENIIINKTRQRQININQSRKNIKKPQNRPNQYRPNFTFQVDSTQQISSHSTATFNHDKPPTNKQSYRPSTARVNPNIQYNQQKMNKQFKNEPTQRPKTSRIVHQNIFQSNGKVSRNSSTNNDKDTQKIDRLSSKLEQYIKFNKQKIQRNTKFIRQNSTSHR